jgi:diguanylate cyclase (GGDEF)-like protein
MRALVADDDLVSRIMLQSEVETLGHECAVATDGDEAWDMYQNLLPDVLITDRLMPGIDGLELCRRIRTRPVVESHTYIILATALTDRSDVLTGMEAGADDYLTKPLDPLDLRMRLIAAQRVTALHAELAGFRSELSRLACTDSLTQLRNRLTLADDLKVIHARSRRSGAGYCLAMCDVDNFKLYNDTYGHQAGDEVLRRLGAMFAAQTREGDTVYRYGGEEFLLILPDQTLESAAVAGERIRRAVEGLVIPHRDSRADVVTISVGVAAFDLDADRTSEVVLAKADAALYEAKSAGRNRVHLAKPAWQPSP